MLDQIYHISISTNRVDPYQATLVRAAWSGSALFVKALKGVPMK